MPLNHLFVDFNAYFASVEQQEKPHLRNKPVAVVPVMANTTCCIAASYEAKKFGVKTGTIVSDAKKLCPNIKFVVASHRIYVEYHHALVNAVNECLPVDKVYSIDEMDCCLIGKEKNKEEAVKIAKRIKDNIKLKVGNYIKCSIGISTNRFLAKTATDMQKPDGLTVIEKNDLPNCLYTLKLSDIYGVGRKMEKRLIKNGIYSVEQLCRADKILLHKIWGGIEGERLYEQLRGNEVTRPLTHRSTVGHSHVLPPNLRTNEKAFAVLNKLLQKAAMRLRYLGYFASGLAVVVKYSDYPKMYKWKKHISFNFTQNTIEFLKALNLMWKDNNFLLTINKPVAVGIVLYNLIHEKFATVSLFENYDKNKSLYNAIDSLNKRHGNTTVYFSGSHLALNSAPMRIAFSQIPNLEIEDD